MSLHAIDMVERSHGLHLRALQKETREAEFVASTDAIDSCGEVVDQSWNLDRYKKNPVVLFSHDSRELPIGHCTAVGVFNGQLECKIKFVSADANPKAEQVWQSIQEGALRAVSVGFMPGDYRYEKRNGQEVFVLSNNELYEISVVSVPANPEALAKARAKAKELFQQSHLRQENAMELEQVKAMLDEKSAELESEKSAKAEMVAQLDATKAEVRLLNEKVTSLTEQLEGAKERAEKSEETLLERYVESFIGTKITPAEKDLLFIVAKKDRATFEAMMSVRPELKLLGQVISSADPVPPTVDDGTGSALAALL